MADFVGTTSSETITGTSGNDVINAANGGTDTLDGGAGDDRLISDGGGDVLLGGAGTDIADLRLQYLTSGVVIDIASQLALTNSVPGSLYQVGAGVVFLSQTERLFFYGGSGNDVVFGGEYGDRLDGGSGADILYGKGGDDQLFGHNGNLILDGGDGNDVITIDGYVSQIDGGSGLDKLYINGTAGFDAAGHVGNITNVEQIWVKAGLGPISFSHDQAPNVLNSKIYGFGIGVVDVSDGMGGYLGATIIASEFADTIKGGSGDDHLIGNKGNDVLYGGAGDDVLEGGIGGDRLYGQAGNDHFILFSGPNQGPDVLVDGGDGVDSINLNVGYATAGVTIDFSNPAVAQIVNGTTIVNVEVLDFNGSAFGDTVTGGHYDDKIDSGAGDDWVTGGGGNDLLVGGNGFDTAVYSGNAADYTISKAGDVYTISDNRGVGFDGTDTFKQFEQVKFADGVVAVSALTLV